MLGEASRLQMFDVPRPRRVLVLAPHPDDEAVGCGGLLSALADSGADVTVVFVTDGERNHAGRPDPELATQRRAESGTAAGVLGVRRIIRWGLPDGDLSTHELPIEPLRRAVTELGVEMILVPHVDEAHADHAAVARMAGRLDAGSGELAVMTYEVWTPLEPNRVLNVSTYMQRKLQAIRAYGSQCERFNLERLAIGLSQYRAAWSRMRWQHAECYQLFSLAQYREWCNAD